MSSLPLVAAVGLVGFMVSACASHPRAQLPAPTPPPPVAAAPAPATLEPIREDPVQTLIAGSERHFGAGRRQLELGHLEQAKSEFDRAVNVLIESPYGARTEPRLREHFDRLVDRINAYELTALAQGDGFEEKRYEPASLDKILESSTFASPPPGPALKAAVALDLKVTEHDVPIPFNARVLQYVDLFQGRLREFISEGLARGSQYLPMIQNVFRAEGLPLDLAYIPLIESAFKPNALSRAKAKGVWQFMRGTALENGLRQDWYIDERSDPEKATVAAAKYLRTLHKMLGGDWHLALASYNGGPGRVQRAVKKSGLDDFWTLSGSTKYLPRETREYVPMILAAIIIAKNPAQYGFEVITAEAPPTYDKVEVPKGFDLRRVAEWAGTSIDQIQQLNPELRRWTTPLRDTAYAVKVPAGTADQVRDRLASADPGELTALRWYRVKPRETLVSIARQLRVNRTDLAEANNLKVNARVKPGQELVIPRAPATAMAARIDRPAPAETVARSRSLGAVASAAPVAEHSGRMKVFHQVRRGDTLFSIARVYNTTVDAIKNWNKQLRGNRITPGDRLTLFTNRRVAAR